MKHKLLFLFLIFIVPFKNFAQTPCGISSLEVCDANNDGVVILDITEGDTIYPFCMVNADFNDYYAPTHHLTQADADTGVNPITNPETFNGSDGQSIFMRAEPLNSATDPVLAFQTYEIVFTSCPDPSFTMTPTCDGATATITGDIGGTFAFDPAPTDGVSLDPTWGVVNNATNGATYCVTYTISGSESVSSTECFTALSFEDSSFILTPTCDGATAFITGQVGGTFYLNPDPGDGTVINPPTGEVTGATQGSTYTVEYTTSGPCPSSTLNTFTVLTSQDSNFSMTPTCNGGTATILGDTGGTFAFNPNPGDGAVIDSTIGEVTGGTIGTAYTVEYTIGGQCGSTSTQTFTTLAIIANAPPNIITCDSNASDGFSQFDLTQTVSEITGGDAGIMVSYFETLSNAQNNVNAISNPTTYNNIVNSQTIYIGVDDGSCYQTGEFTIGVLTMPSTPIELVICDYTNVNDGISQFELSSLTSEILNGFSPNDVGVTYHETTEDAEAGINVLSSPYMNTTSFNQTIYAKVQDFTSGGCYVVVPVNLIVQYCLIPCGESVNINYCYTDNDTTTFNFTSENGMPLTLVFNAGHIEDGVDSITVLDSDGTTELYSGSGNSGNFTGFTFLSSGDSITVQLNSDDANSCSNQNYTPLDFDIFCSDYVGVIQLNAFLDANTNGVFDAGEILFNNGTFSYEINNNGSVFNVNTSSGSYVITNFDESFSYDVSFTPFVDFQTCLTQSVSSFEDIMVSNGSSVILNFPLVEVQDCDDIAVSLIPYNAPQPGFTHYIRLNITNYGDVEVSGSVDFVYDDLVFFNEVSYLTPGNTIDYTANGFTLYFNNLLPGEQEYIVVTVDIPVTVELGQLIIHSVTYSADDLDLTNNYFELTETVVNSYDPNDKMEAHGREIVIDDFTSDDYLYYTIRFQNLGTAPAIYVRIEDVLDAQLDPSTFKMLDASHDYSVESVGSNLTWYFNNINLPHESMDEEGSNGYIVFRIKPYTGYQAGDIIPNYADIYFDFNPAITTNTYETEFVSPLSTGDFTFDKIKVYPNPVNSIINIQTESSNEALTVQIIGLQGKLIMNQNLEGTSMNVSQLNPGVYFLKIKDQNAAEKVFKLVKN